MSFGVIFAGFTFGVIGVALLRLSKQRANIPLALIGVSLLVFPYFVSQTWLTWGIGGLLCWLAYVYRW